MKLKWIVNSIIVILLCLVALLGLAHLDSAVAAEGGSDKIEGLLSDQIVTDGSADFIIQFTEQADLSPAYSMDWDARGAFVYDTLREIAGRSQSNTKAILDAQGLSYQTFIAGNELYVRGRKQIATNGLMLLNELAALPEVNFIRATRTYYIDPVIEVKPFDNINWAGDLLANHLLTTVGSSIDASLDWGITDTKADQFWTTFGVKGDGIVVANIDTGVQWNHPALDQAFKCGTNPSDPACWYDPANKCGAGGVCDNQGHGTHTMGTMVGDDDPSLTYRVGMAPNAKWIACKGCEDSSCSDISLNACADWILAPAGNPANRPNVVNNSWGGGGGDTWFLAKVNAWRAAGIFPAFSAGNTGPNCSTLGSPGDYQESFGSAAHNSSRNIASFSSRGPSSFGHDPYTKPNLSAPGVNICSTVPTNNWSCGYSGTSMASPHTAGAVALLWSCNPSLKGNIDATFRLLQNNTDAAPAGTCGAPADGQGNYTYGYGYLDVLAAGDATCGNQGGAWKQITLPPGCPDWTRYDGEYYAGTGKVYFLGGRDGTDGMVTYGDIYSYDPKANICADTGTDMPTPISNYTIVQLNDGNADLLCTFGGRDTAGNNTLAVQCFKPITNTVTTKANLPVNFTGFQPGGTAVVNNKAYIFGGFRQTPSPYNINITFEYNPLTDNYSAKGNLALPRSFIDAAVVDNKIYAFGGDIYDGTNQYAQTKSEVFNTLSGTWSDAAVAELPIATAEGTAYGYDSNSIYRFAGKIIIAGGGQFPGETTRAFSYDSATNTYNYAFPNLNVSRRNQAGFFVPGDPGAMWVFGGRSGSDSPPYAPPEIFGLYSIYFPITFK